MERDRGETAESNVEERLERYRDGVADADATGMVAGEEAIVSAEVLAPLLNEPPEFPQADLHAALAPGHEGHAAIDAAHAQYAAVSPDKRSYRRSRRAVTVDSRTRGVGRELVGQSRNQRFMWNVTQIGL